MSDDGKTNPLVYLTRKTWRYSEGNRKNIVIFVILFLLAEVVDDFMVPLVWARIMNTVQTNGINFASLNTLLWYLGSIVVLSVVFWTLHGPARVLERANAFKARSNYREFLTSGVLGMSMEWHSDHHSGDTIDKMAKGSDALFAFSKDSFRIIYTIAQLVIGLCMLAYISWSSTLLLAIPAAISIYITVRIDKVLIENYRALSRGENHISEGVIDAVSNISTVIVLRVEKLVFDSLMHRVWSQFNLYRDNSVLNEVKWFLTSLCTRATIFFVLGFYFWQVSRSGLKVEIGSVYLLITYLKLVNDTYFNFAGMYGDVVQNKVRVMNAEELSVDFVSQSLSNHVLPTDWKKLEIRDLNFSYHGEDGNPHINNASFDLYRGEKVAIVGGSGSGKTTLFKILRDLYHPQSITLLQDGKLVEDGFAGICRAISLMPQKPEIFKTTILNNITLGVDYSPELVRKYSDMACFTPVALALPHGFDSSIKEKGVNLSGGEQQRLALSRGLLASHDKDIVLLDEPTSSLDVSNEIEVYRNVFNAFRDKTVISSIHRLQLLPLFDRVMVFDGGKIVGSGKVEDLKSNCPQFAELWKKQFVED